MAKSAHRIQAEASLKDLNSDDDAFKLKAAYDLKSEHLTADMAYHESKGGLVAGLLGLKDLEGIQLTATAQGPVSHIKGDLNLNMGGYGNAALQYDVNHRETVTLQLSGQIKADSRILPPQVAKVMTSETVDLTLNASLSPEKEVLLKEFRIKNGSMIISLEGAADLEKEKMDMRALIEEPKLTPFLAGTGISLDGLGPVRIAAVGPFMAPEVNISTTLAAFKTQAATLDETTLKVRALFEKGFKGLKSASVTLGAQGVQVQQVPKLAGPVKLNIQALSPDFSTWQVKALNATLPGAAVSVKDALINLTEERFFRRSGSSGGPYCRADATGRTAPGWSSVHQGPNKRRRPHGPDGPSENGGFTAQRTAA